MDTPGSPTSDSALKKRPSGGGTGLLDGLRRTFVNFLRHPQSTALPRKESLRRQNMTLPRLPQPEGELSNQILVTERLLPESSAGVLQRRFSAYTETPEAVQAEFIRLDKLSGGNGEYAQVVVEALNLIRTRDDPVDCHMTCHWLCKDKVTISCEVSPPPAHTTISDDDDDDGAYTRASSGDCDLDNSIAAERTEPNSEDGYLSTPATSRFSSQVASTDSGNLFANLPEVLRPHQTSTAAMARAVSMGPEIQATSVLANIDSKQHRSTSSPTLRPDSQLSLSIPPNSSLKVDQSSKADKENEHQQPSPQPSPLSVSPQGSTTRHQSMLQPRRRHHNHRPSELSRRHTTAVNLASVTAGTYDISSLDQRDIRERGISVWQLIPAAASPLTSSSTVAATDAPPVVMSSRMQATRLAAVTGHQTGAEEVTYTKVTTGPRNGVLPWKPMELARRLDIFNANDFGLCAKMTPKLQPGDCEGQVRVHINLIRPVRMVLTARPPSIFDIVGGGDDGGDDPSSGEEASNRTQQPESVSSVRLRGKTIGRITSFRLPRGSSKLLHVHLSTTASQVISSLLARFNIDDNPQKFALYEHTIFGENDVSVRKLFDDESPLGLLLQWTLDPSVEVGGKAGEALHREHFNVLLAVKRIVLQENETGDIEWSCFSEAELRTFLSILNREEADYRRRIELKYQIRKREILRLMNLRARSHQRTNAFTAVIASPTTAANNLGGDDEDAKSLAPRAECDSLTPPLPYLPSGDVVRLEGTESGKGGEILRTVQSPNRPLCLPDSPPTSTFPTFVGASEITSPLRGSQAHLLTKVHQKKKKVRLKKNMGKKLKVVKENSAKSSNTKSNVWLKKKK
ncbi:unnamed protein product [Taenia asiatica]|uniref:Ras-associating domain-containing protein n=1 Tax=Taenia asiatica TaxID=60517 RepID=A0A0R3WAX2_TAEAS|nr:unnamed protein product [Taenia asiatica]